MLEQNNKGKTILIAIIAIISVIITGVYFATWNPPKSNRPESKADTASTGVIETDTKDWLVYKSDNYGFEIKHPKDWVKIEFPNRWNEDIMGVDFTGSFRDFSCYFSIKIAEKERPNYAENQANILEKMGWKKHYEKIGDYQIIRLENFLTYIFFIDDDRLEISTGGTKYTNNNNGTSFKSEDLWVTDENCGKIFKQMLSTLKFL